MGSVVLYVLRMTATSMSQKFQWYIMCINIISELFFYVLMLYFTAAHTERGYVVVIN